MKVLFLISLACVLVVTVTAMVRSFRSFADPEHPGKCVVVGKVLSPGQKELDDSNCMGRSCYDEEGYGSMEYCDPDFILKSDPDCCRKKGYFVPPGSAEIRFTNTYRATPDEEEDLHTH